MACQGKRLVAAKGSSAGGIVLCAPCLFETFFVTSREKTFLSSRWTWRALRPQPYGEMLACMPTSPSAHASRLQRLHTYARGRAGPDPAATATPQGRKYLLLPCRCVHPRGRAGPAHAANSAPEGGHCLLPLCTPPQSQGHGGSCARSHCTAARSPALARAWVHFLLQPVTAYCCCMTTRGMSAWSASTSFWCCRARYAALHTSLPLDGGWQDAVGQRVVWIHAAAETLI
jgi:hypothetical protein